MFRFLLPKEAKSKLPKTKSTVDFSYINLEARQVLNADFDFDGFSLDFDNFSNSDPADNTDRVTVSGSGGNYFFSLSEGVFSGNDSSSGLGAAISGLGTGIISVSDPNGDLASITLEDSNSDTFDILFGGFQFDGSLSITSSNGAFGEITQDSASVAISDFDFVANSVTLDTLSNDFGQIIGTAVGDISLTDTGGISGVDLDSSLGDISVTSTGDIQYDALRSAGDLDLTSEGQVTDSSSAELAISGNVSISATDEILLNNDAGNTFSAGLQTTLAAGSILIGPQGDFDTGFLNFNSVGDVSISEDGDTQVVGTNTADSLTLKSSGSFSSKSESPLTALT